jgi:hypothetical protein
MFSSKEIVHTSRQREQSKFRSQANGSLPSHTILHGWEEWQARGCLQQGVWRYASEVDRSRHLGEFLFTTGATVLPKFSLWIYHGSRKCLNRIALIFHAY